MSQNIKMSPVSNQSLHRLLRAVSCYDRLWIPQLIDVRPFPGHCLLMDLVVSVVLEHDNNPFVHRSGISPESGRTQRERGG
jgi:hypothetical protein